MNKINLQEMARITIGNDTYRTKNDLIASLYRDGLTVSQAFNYITQNAPTSGITQASISSMYSRLRSLDRNPERAQNSVRTTPADRESAQRTSRNGFIDNTIDAGAIHVDELPHVNNEAIPAVLNTQVDIDAYNKLRTALDNSHYIKIANHLINGTNVEAYTSRDFMSVVLVSLSRNARIQSNGWVHFDFIEDMIKSIRNPFIKELVYNYYRVNIIDKLNLNEINIISTTDNMFVCRANIQFDTERHVQITHNGISYNFPQTKQSVNKQLSPYINSLEELTQKLSSYTKQGQDVSQNRVASILTDIINRVVEQSELAHKNILKICKYAKLFSAEILNGLSELESDCSIFYTVANDESHEQLDNTNAFADGAQYVDHNNNYVHLAHIKLNDYKTISNSGGIKVFLRVKGFNFWLGTFSLSGEYAYFDFKLAGDNYPELIKKLLGAGYVTPRQNTTPFDVMNQFADHTRLMGTIRLNTVEELHELSMDIIDNIRKIYENTEEERLEIQRQLEAERAAEAARREEERAARRAAQQAIEAERAAESAARRAANNRPQNQQVSQDN